MQPYIAMIPNLLLLYCHDCPFVAFIFTWLPICCSYIITIAHVLLSYCHVCQFVALILSQLPISCFYIVMIVHLLLLYCHDCPFFAVILSWLSICCHYIVTNASLLPTYCHNSIFVASILLWLSICCSWRPTLAMPDNTRMWTNNQSPSGCELSRGSVLHPLYVIYSIDLRPVHDVLYFLFVIKAPACAEPVWIIRSVTWLGTDW